MKQCQWSDPKNAYSQEHQALKYFKFSNDIIIRHDYQLTITKVRMTQNMTIRLPGIFAKRIKVVMKMHPVDRPKLRYNSFLIT